MAIFFATAGFITGIAMLSAPTPVWAYIGPGAGFAVISSFFILLMAGSMALLAVAAWPFRALIHWIKRRKVQRRRKARRVVILGLDGLDPRLAGRFIKTGKLPNFRRLKKQGSFRSLKTTTPSISPVAWSTFSTGVNPGKHRIFDFYTRDPDTYLPVLSSVRISTFEKVKNFGLFKIKKQKPLVRFLRKSVSFWTLLGKSGVFCSILRVPISFPPEKFYGTCLSAMCTPDLRGTQGTFTLFTSDPEETAAGIGYGGTVVPIVNQSGRIEFTIPGPSPGGRLEADRAKLTVRGTADTDRQQLTLEINRSSLRLAAGVYSPWIKLKFKLGRRRFVSGIGRFLVKDLEPHVRIYLTPINIDPERPALPVSSPTLHSAGLAKLYGDYATLGLAEDTWALNADVIDESEFLQQSYDIFEERKKHLLDALKRNKDGLIVTVFDTTDRIQHMFFRYLDPQHPANSGKKVNDHKEAVEQVYAKADQLLGDVLKGLDPNDVLFVVSDHGFHPFKWGVNLNSWLHQEGYLALEDNVGMGGQWYAGIDWGRTRAFAFGLSGIFINLKGRERLGIVGNGGERRELLAELKAKLEQLYDPYRRRCPIRRAIVSEEALAGPYLPEAPDLMIGYRPGYRASWNSAVGQISETVFEDNTRRWSGDHSIDPQLVPGVCFCTRKINGPTPSIADLAPTVMDLFGLKPPAFYDGRVLGLDTRSQSAAVEGNNFASS